ncbi:hypothetical protein KC851_00220 [Candidatus Kaiserbacteria bacterium]|nr:hypothetical protein [Candidatus Kaiserbacteria bacterium]
MSKGSRYSDMGEMSAFAMLASAMGGRDDAGNPFPQSDANDFSRGVKFVPGEVTVARRAGKTVEFHAPCQSSTCCWYWQMPDGSRIYHFERHHFERIRDEHEGICPECGNANIAGGTISA